MKSFFLNFVYFLKKKSDFPTKLLIFGGKISCYDFCELFNLLRSTFLEKALTSFE